MTRRLILDAGPAINFFSVNQERLLISVVGHLCNPSGMLSAPETVEAEVFQRSRKDQRFRRAEGVWRKLKPRYMDILSDDVTPELSRAVSRIEGSPLSERRRNRRDLGETMAIAHATLLGEAGMQVVILLDEGEGREKAAQEAHRLTRLRTQYSNVGSI